MGSTAGRQVSNFSKIVGLTQSTVLNSQVSSGGQPDTQDKVFFHNGNKTGNIYLGLAGETVNATATPPIGVWLAPGAFLLLDITGVQSPITAIADTAGLQLTIYGLGA